VVATRLLTTPGPYCRHPLVQRPAAPNKQENDQRADPLPRSITLEIPRSLLANLRELSTTDIDGDGHAVGELLAALIRALEASVLSYCGLQLTISQNGFPVVLTAFDGHDGAVGTSLRVPLALLDSGFTTESRIVFYAGTPGAFVDLAADLTFALGAASIPEPVRDSAPPGIRLDADPLPRTRGFNLSGLTELTTIDRAVGVMIGQGHHPDDAYQTLRGDAARAGLDPYAWAAQLLRRARTRRLESADYPDD
jgi:hypothetical protein